MEFRSPSILTESPVHKGVIMATHLTESTPAWLLRPLPINAKRDAKLETQIEKLAQKLPESLAEINQALKGIMDFHEYDSAANLANGHVWPNRRLFLQSVSGAARRALLEFAQQHMTPTGKSRIIRRLSKDVDLGVRRAVHRMISKNPPREVALPGRFQCRLECQWLDAWRGTRKTPTRSQWPKETAKSVEFARHQHGGEIARTLGHQID